MSTLMQVDNSWIQHMLTLPQVDYFNSSVKLINEHGSAAPSFLKYMASKTLAEQAAWKWVEDNKPSFEVVTTLPSWVFGVRFLSS